MIKKIINIQSQLKCEKSQYNDFGKYKYRSCEDILEAVKPLLKQEELMLNVSDEIVMIGTRYYVKATAEISDGTNKISTIAYAREDEIKKGMDGSQITGAASSYARKYALNGLFCIDDTKDADTTNKGTQRESESNELTVMLKGKTYKLTDLSKEQLKWIADNYKNQTIKAKAIELLSK